ncbi:DUF4982 domain-containing protein [Alistipes sp. OttesenSCG-928-L06]|nr:DUF4982 domain-containing protein [Alistipes sp. OttesenSCG-928-L06]
MRRFLILTLAALAALTGTLTAREVFNINREWQFSYTSDLRSRTTVDIPHSWNHDAVAFRQSLSRGMASYIKNINIPREWQNKRVYIRFHGVNSEASLFVNGFYAGQHKGGYTGFTFEVTPLLKLGVLNNFWVRVSNAPQLDYMPINSDFNLYGGIYRDVELIVVDAVHFAPDDHGSDGIYLRQSQVDDKEARITATVKVNSAKNANYTVTVSVKDPQTDSVLVSQSARVKTDKGSGSVDVPVVVENPRLWHGIYDPFRYDFRVELRDGDKILDTQTIPLGLRYYTIDPANGFMLNGRVYPLHGVTRYEDRANAGNAYLPRMHDEDFALIREMGANAVRMTNYPHAPYFYELCDRNGVIVWSEIPFAGPYFGADNGFINKPEFRDNGRQQLTEMILQRYNNTSVLFWGLFSNLQTRGSDDPTEYVRELNTLARSLDPTRLTVASSNQDGPINFVTDAIGWSQYLGWREGQVTDVNLWLSQLSRNWKDLKSAVGEYGAGGSLRHQSDTLRRPEPRERRHPERWQTHYHEQFYTILQKYPSVWGSFVHSMFDFGEANYHGSDTPGVSDLGLVSYDRKEKKDAFYFYKANWNALEPFMHIAEKRWDVRAESKQTVIVFSNRPEVELFVNGISHGTRTGTHGTFRWEQIQMQEGVNTLEVHADHTPPDQANITIRKAQRIQ